MKKILFSFIVFYFLLTPFFVFAQRTVIEECMLYQGLSQSECEAYIYGTTPNGTSDYVLLAPINIEGQELRFDAENNRYVSVLPIGDERSFADFVNSILKLSIGLASAFAVLMIVIAGAKYMTQGSVTGKSNALSDVRRALWGLGIALLSVLLLNTINPDLTSLKGISPATASTTNFGTLVKNQFRGPGFYFRVHLTNDLYGPFESKGECKTAQYALMANNFINLDLENFFQVYDDCIYFDDDGNEAVSPSDSGAMCLGGEDNCLDIFKEIDANFPIKSDSNTGIHKDLIPKLKNLHTTLSQQQIQWQITEAFPPEWNHASQCHYNGTCFDANFTGQSAVLVQTADLNTQVAYLMSFFKAASDSGLRAVYEIRERNRADKILEAFEGISIPGGGEIKFFGTHISADHFSVYND